MCKIRTSGLALFLLFVGFLSLPFCWLANLSLPLSLSLYIRWPLFYSSFSVSFRFPVSIFSPKPFFSLLLQTPLQATIFDSSSNVKQAGGVGPIRQGGRRRRPWTVAGGRTGDKIRRMRGRMRCLPADGGCGDQIRPSSKALGFLCLGRESDETPHRKQERRGGTGGAATGPGWIRGT